MNTTTQIFDRHPLSAFFYDMPQEEFDSLKDSISKHGVLNPIVLHDDLVLDGWHRYKATQELDVPCPFVYFDDQYNGIDVKDFVIVQNKERKSLTQSQLALAVVKVTEWMPAHRPRKDEDEKSTSSGRAFSEDEIAEKSGVSKSTVQRAKKIVRDATPEVQKAVEEGKIGVKKAAEISKLPKEEQAEAISKPLPKKEELTDEEIAAGLDENPYEIIARLEKETIELNEQIISLTERGEESKEIVRLHGIIQIERGRADNFQRRSYELQQQVKRNGTRLRKLSKFYENMCEATDRKDCDEMVSYVKNLRAKFR